MTLEEIIKKYPKTDDCELQTLGELHKWQIEEIKKLIQHNQLNEVIIEKDKKIFEENIHFKEWILSLRENKNNDFNKEDIDILVRRVALNMFFHPEHIETAKKDYLLLTYLLIKENLILKDG